MEKDKELSNDELQQATGGRKKQQADLGQNQSKKTKPLGTSVEGEADPPFWQQG